MPVCGRTAELVKIRDSFAAILKNLQGKKSGEWLSTEDELSGWFESRNGEISLSPFETLLINEMLPSIGRELSGSLRDQLWRCAFTTAVNLSSELPEPTGSNVREDQRAVIAGELPFQAGLLFAGVKGSARLRQQGARELNKTFLDATDTDGTPHAGRMERLPFWLAPLVRAKQWADVFDVKLFTEEADERFQDLISVVTPMCRVDGQLALGNGFAFPAVPLLESAARSARLKKKSAPMRYLAAVDRFSQKHGKGKHPTPRKVTSLESKKTTSKNRRTQPPVVQSDWAQLACLRSGWSLDADAIVVAHDEILPRIEMSALGLPLFSGEWEIELSLDGRKIKTKADWSCSCWYSDDEVDFLELQQTLEKGVTIDRQVFLSRTDNFAMFADSVSVGSEAVIEYRQRLPLADGINFESDVPSRECRLKQNGLNVRAFPLALAADRVQSTPGSFGREGESLELRQTAVGGLYAPVMLDWSPKRKRSLADWRTLTVAEDGQRLTSADASGYRIRIGNHQLLVYRALTKSHFSRSVLGQHTRNETLIGHFRKTGKVAPLLIVE